jgi:NitT/TauT family transport system substrate-binding protein
MTDRQDHDWTRREFLEKVSLAGTATLLGLRSELFPAESLPETRTLRLSQTPNICWAPLYMAEELLRSEGFTDVQYIKTKGGEESEKLLASGKANMSMGFAARHLRRVDEGDPSVILAGVHIGCFELFGTDRVRSIRDLKGKRVSVGLLGSGRHLFLASMVAYVGLDPRKDINWITKPPAKAMQLFAEGKIDAYMGFPPEPQELRARKVGRVIVNTMMDKPWSQYFCCAVVANREFVGKHPMATKRALRAILKATDVTAQNPERAARFVLEKGITNNYDHALEALKDIPYAKWREHDPEDTLRFYSLRLHEVGMIKTSPNMLIPQAADWRFLKELKKELKT